MNNNPSSQESNLSWIDQFHSTPGHEYFCKVDVAFLKDRFSLIGLETEVSNLTDLIQLITDTYDANHPYRLQWRQLTLKQRQTLMHTAAHLYGLVHARFLASSPRGLTKMMNKLKNKEFGRCPRALCKGQGVVPVGLDDTPRKSCVRLYCPQCEDIYLSVAEQMRATAAEQIRATVAEQMRAKQQEQEEEENDEAGRKRYGGSDILGDSSSSANTSNRGTIRTSRASRQSAVASTTTARFSDGEANGGRGSGLDIMESYKIRDRSGIKLAVLDSAYFGTSLPALLFQMYPYLVPHHPQYRPSSSGGGNGGGGDDDDDDDDNNTVVVNTNNGFGNGCGSDDSDDDNYRNPLYEKYVPKIYGFKVHEYAKLERWQQKQREKGEERVEEMRNRLRMVRGKSLAMS